MSTKCTLLWSRWFHLYHDYHDDRVYLDCRRLGCLVIPMWLSRWAWGFGDEYKTWKKNYKKT